MAITAAMVKALRERTGAGMMECKKALVESNGDIELAIEEMRKKSGLKAAKRAGRTASEGAIVSLISSDKKQGVLVDVNCETDFVARGDDFLEFANKAAEVALSEDVDSVEALMQAKVDGTSLDDVRQALISKLGENIQVRRLVKFDTDGMIGNYLHGNRIGVLVEIDSENDDLVKDLAMHIAAANPQAVSEADLPASVLEKEKDIYSAQAQESGKPANIIEKMVEGRLRKFVDEICLVGQPFVKNPDQSILDLLKAHNANVKQFIRYEVGEGIEKEVVDFAKEVEAQVKGSQ